MSNEDEETPRCAAITKSGTRCKREAHAGHAFCTFHLWFFERNKKESESE